MRRLTTLLLMLGLTATANAQSMVDVSRLGSMPVRKDVVTLRDLRYRDMVRQRYDFSCGSAALATLLNYGYGEHVSEPEMIRRMMVGTDAKTVVQQGFSMLDMKRYVEGRGMQARGFRVDAAALYRLRMPVIALLDLKGYKHFVIVKGAEAGRVFVADPALGHRVMNENDFTRGWNGIVLAVIGDRPLLDSALVNNRESLALRRRVETLGSATQPVPVVELGLVRADLF
ncbi:C39 family peptidase [Cognatilysobacter lacus]|nr:C39 family peptidase [Lysobacter lacus]